MSISVLYIQHNTKDNVEEKKEAAKRFYESFNIGFGRVLPFILGLMK